MLYMEMLHQPLHEGNKKEEMKNQKECQVRHPVINEKA